MTWSSSGVPVLGLCLGSQLMADALGGKAFLGEKPETGVVPVTLTDAGKADPVVSKTGPMVYAQHQDTFVLPPDAVLLAHTDRYPHAFRVGSGLALQFHPDADRDHGSGVGQGRWAAAGRRPESTSTSTSRD